MRVVHVALRSRVKATKQFISVLLWNGGKNEQTTESSEHIPCGDSLRKNG